MYNQTLNNEAGAFSVKMNRQYTRRSPELRFFDKVEKAANGCWLWTACKTNKGYGQFARVDGTKVEYAHRASYKMFVGEIGPGLFVCHKCDNPACVNPEHLFLGNQRDNMSDMSRKFRSNTKLTADDVREIRATRTSAPKLAAAYGLKSAKSIYDIWYGRTFASVAD